MQKRDLVLLDALADEMVTGVDMLGARMVLRIFGQGLCPLVVDVERNWGVGLEMKFSEYVLDP